LTDKKQQDLATVRELALMGKGRLLYAQKRYEEAVKTYEAVPRFSRYWDQALFELGFARFRAEDYGGALGSVQALPAPQLEDGFQTRGCASPPSITAPASTTRRQRR